jgi:hypothetical protein
MSKAPKSDRGPGKRLSQQEVSWFNEQVFTQGRNPYEVASQLGISRTTARRLVKKAAEEAEIDNYEDYSTATLAKRMVSNTFGESDKGEIVFPDPITTIEALPNLQAQKAWKEFGYHRRRYFNRRHIAWQIEMVQILLAWWESGQGVKGTEESEVIKGIINTPPGGGKTTTISHDFPAWVLSRQRNTRIALGARTTPQATKYTRRLRNTLERNPLLNLEFGRFKPVSTEVWRVDEFIIDGVTGHAPSVEYMLSLAGFDPDDKPTRRRLDDPEDDIHEILDSLGSVFLTGEKEASVMALSQEMGFLGGRFDLNLWDDLCDKKNSSSPEQREDLIEWWFAEAESRCEPGGIVGLIGTRFGKYDLFRHCKDLEYTTEDEVEQKVLSQAHGAMSEEELQALREDIEREMVDQYGHNIAELATPSHSKGMSKTRKVYHYYKFPAHDSTKCTSPNSLRNDDHIRCVLDPKRFSFRHLNKVRAQDPRKWNLTYQQDDEDLSSNLVQTEWLTGGAGPGGIIYPGCYDYQRRLLEYPTGLSRENIYSIATLDPSSSNWWSLQWWLYDADEDMDYLMDILRARLTSGGFLDWNMKRDEFDGVADKWQLRSMAMELPIKVWIVESNAAQRYLYQHKWVKDWMKLRKTFIMPHETGRNKADSDFGVESLGPRYQQGLVNLPYHERDLKTRVKVDEFTAELKEWPDYPTEDTVMGHWFLQFNRYKLPDSFKVIKALGSKNRSHPYDEDMPDYVRNERRSERDPAREPVAVGHRNAANRYRDLR